MTYVLCGLSEETRESERKQQLVERQRKLLSSLDSVDEKLQDALSKKKERMKLELYYAENELEKTNLELSGNKYRNKIVMRVNRKNNSKLNDVAFRYPIQESRTTTQNAYTSRLLGEGKHIDPVNKIHDENARKLGEFTDYMQKCILKS